MVINQVIFRKNAKKFLTLELLKRKILIFINIRVIRFHYILKHKYYIKS